MRSELSRASRSLSRSRTHQQHLEPLSLSVPSTHAHTHTQMTSKLTFVPLVGAQNVNEPLAFVLRVDNFTILLDCGWNDSWDVSLLEPLAQYDARTHTTHDRQRRLVYREAYTDRDTLCWCTCARDASGSLARSTPC